MNSFIPICVYLLASVCKFDFFLFFYTLFLICVYLCASVGKLGALGLQEAEGAELGGQFGVFGGQAS